MKFIWDQDKYERNIRLHKINFETAALVFADPYRIEKFDEKHSVTEDRFIVIGEIANTMFVVMLVYTDRDDAIRIISARKATPQERREYYDRRKRH